MYPPVRIFKTDCPTRILFISHMYPSVRIFNTDLEHTLQAVRLGRTDDGPSQQLAR
jgi:hypothetical protein